MNVPRELVPGNLVLVKSTILDWYFECVDPLDFFVDLFTQQVAEIALILNCEVIEHVFSDGNIHDPLVCILFLVEFLVNGIIVTVLFRIPSVRSSDINWDGTGSLEVENFLKNFVLLNSLQETDAD